MALAISIGTAIVTVAVFAFLVMKVRHPRRSPHCPSGLDGVTHPRDLDWPCEDVVVHGHEGVRLTGWFVPSDGPPGACVLLLHGHRKNKIQMLRHGRYLRRAGYDLLFMDMRHHGDSEDGPLALGAYGRLDLALVVAFLRDRPRTRTAQLAAMGLSLGATTAVAAALDGVSISAVVADSPSADQARTMADYGWILYRVPRPVSFAFLRLAVWFAGVDLECVTLERRLAGADLPVLLLHGEKDSRVGVEHARRLAALPPPGRRRLVVFPHADHVGGHTAEPARYEAAVLDFLAEFCPPPSRV